MTRNANLRTILLFIGFAITMVAFGLGVILNFSAAGAAGLNFFEMAMLNKFGIFMMVWNYNPLAYLGIIGLAFVGMIFFIAGKR